MFQNKEQGKTPKEELSGDKQSIQQKVQGKDHKDAQQTQEKNTVRILTKSQKIYRRTKQS